MVVSLPSVADAAPGGGAAVATTPAQYPPFDTEVRPVDVFLRNNPCFLPLHDPPVNVTRETRDYAEVRPPHAPSSPIQLPRVCMNCTSSWRIY